MQFNTRLKKFKPTKHESNQLAASLDHLTFIARNADGEPIGDAALKAVEGLQAVIGKLKTMEAVA